MDKISAKLSWFLKKHERLFRVDLQRWFDKTNRKIRHDLVKTFAKAKIPEFTDWEFIESEGKRILKPVTLNIYLAGKKMANEVLGLKASFDVLDVNAVRTVDRICSTLVKEVTRGTKKAINYQIKQGIKEGLSMAKVAEKIKPLIGLTNLQAQSVVNYRVLLAEKFPDLTAVQLDKKTSLYRAKTHLRRAETISRTETARAQNTGYVDGLQELGVDKVEFSASPTACLTYCVPLDGRKYNVEDGADVIPVHPNCTCVMLPVVEERTVRTPRKKPLEI